MAMKKDKYGNRVWIDTNASPAEQKRQMASYNRKHSTSSREAERQRQERAMNKDRVAAGMKPLPKGSFNWGREPGVPPMRQATSPDAPENIIPPGYEGTTQYGPPAPTDETTRGDEPKKPEPKNPEPIRHKTSGSSSSNDTEEDKRKRQTIAGIVQGIGAGMQNLSGFGGATKGFGAAVSAGMKHGSAAVQNQQKLDYYENALAAQLASERDAFNDQMDQIRTMFDEGVSQTGTFVPDPRGTGAPVTPEPPPSGAVETVAAAESGTTGDATEDDQSWFSGILQGVQRRSDEALTNTMSAVSRFGAIP